MPRERFNVGQNGAFGRLPFIKHALARRTGF
jgi:hypothetical protein